MPSLAPPRTNSHTRVWTPRKGGNGGGEVPRYNEWRLKQKVGLIVCDLPHALRRVLGRPQRRETALL